MKISVKLSLALLLCLCCAPESLSREGVAGQDVVRKKVAVYVSGDDVSRSVRTVLEAKLLTAITSSGKYVAVERANEFRRAMQDEISTQFDEVRESQIADIGRRYGARYVVVAEVSEVYDEMFVAARMISVETGLVERACDTSGPAESMAQLICLSQDITDKILDVTPDVNSPDNYEDISVSTNNNNYKNNNGGGSDNDNYNDIVVNILNGHEYVDLGLPSGLKWAAMNIGATSSEDYGYYFAWGETDTKPEYTINNSRTIGQTFSDISGNVELDVASALWGGSWRLPTKAEFEELLRYCSWSLITVTNHRVYKVIGPNGNSIHFPASGYMDGTVLYFLDERGYYWSSTPYEGNSRDAYHLYFDSKIFEVDWYTRRRGRSVRPVSE